jgi:hypothetical protein
MASALQYPCSKLAGFMQRKPVMNIKAIIASLVLGSSSVAMAAPGVSVSATVQGSYGTTVVRDHRAPVVTQPIIWHVPERMPPVYRPVTLASGLSFANDGRTFITVGSQAGRFGTLKIDAAGGRTFIKQVYVQFDNGQEQVVRNLDRTLSGNDCLTLDLDGNRRAIRRIVVYGSNMAAGRRHSAGTFTVSAS